MDLEHEIEKYPVSRTGEGRVVQETDKGEEDRNNAVHFNVDKDAKYA